MSASQRSRVRLIVAIALLASAFSGCVQQSRLDPQLSLGASPSGSWATPEGPSPVALLGDPATSGLDRWPGPLDARPTIHDLDGDGVQEVIVHSNDRRVYVFDVSSGRALGVLETTYPPSWYTENVLNRVQAGTMEPGGPVSLVVANHAAYVSRWQVDASGSAPDEVAFDKRWERRLDACRESPSMDAAPHLADLDGDGSLEMLLQTEEVGLYALDAHGDTLWHHCWSGGNSAPATADLDGDGDLETVFASDAGLVSVLDAATGAPQWTFDVTEHGIEPGSVSQTPTIAELDGRAPKEVLFTARSATVRDPDRYRENTMAIAAVHRNASTGEGQALWLRQPAWANPLSATRIVVEDVDGDGEPDVFGMDWNTIGHRPGNWERLGPAHVFRLDATGQDVWVRQVDAWWSNKDLAVDDVDADGQAEVLAVGPGEGGDGVWQFSADTGKAEGFLPVSPWKMRRGPSVVDLGTGSIHLLAPVEPENEEDDRGAVLVYDTGIATHPDRPSDRSPRDDP